MGCASAKHVSTVQNEEETQKGKNYQNGDVFGDEYRIKPVEEVKYMKNGGEDDQKIAARNQENLCLFLAPGRSSVGTQTELSVLCFHLPHLVCVDHVLLYLICNLSMGYHQRQAA
uniref:Uncharacterized protein n=1 Tax=Taeniopygia guttata TaxID=59729 RepID=A0A674HRI4_TAEGU